MNQETKPEEATFKVPISEFSELHFKIGFATEGLRSILFYVERLQKPENTWEAMKLKNIQTELNRMIKRMERKNGDS